jgi:hypothetical protein
VRTDGDRDGPAPRTRTKRLHGHDAVSAPPPLDAVAGDPEATRIAAPYDEATRERHPYLWQLLSTDCYSDGTRRILPTLRIYRQPGQYCIALQDHEMGRQCQASSTTLQGLWEALEAALRQPNAWHLFKSMVNRQGQPFSLRKKKQ